MANSENSVPITVLMTTHNRERYVSEAIESILAQTFDDFEFIIVDDASSDQTPEIIEDFALKDPRILFYH